MKQETLAKWFISLTCLIGKEDKNYALPETDPDWWALYLWIKRN